MNKRTQPFPYRSGSTITFRVTAKDIAAGGTQAQILERAIARKYGAPVPRWAVRAALKASRSMPNRRSMLERVRHVMAEAKRTGMLVKCGDHWHFGGTLVERFDMETVVAGEPPILLPEGEGGHTNRLTLAEVRAIVRNELEEKDKAGRP